MPYQVMSNLVIPKASGSGIKVDSVAPTFGWRDIVGTLRPDLTGLDAPTSVALRGVKLPFFDNNDVMDCQFHIPHDYVPSSDLYLHVHWSHDHDTGATGAVTFQFTTSYARRSMGTVRTFPAQKTHDVVLTGLNVATNAPQYVHRVDEVVITGASDTSGAGTGTYDRTTIEVDGILLVKITVPTITGLTGGTSGRIAVVFADLHYQSTNMATKDKVEPFWG